jgi:hypothetical protein
LAGWPLRTVSLVSVHRRPVERPLRWKSLRRRKAAAARANLDFDVLHVHSPWRHKSVLSRSFPVRAGCGEGQQSLLIRSCPFYGCRPWCKRFLTFLDSDRVQSSIRPLFAALRRPLAGMVICGAVPNLPDELLRSKGQPGFPDPDLFDHFAHSGHRLLTPPADPVSDCVALHDAHAAALCSGFR